MLSRDYEKKLKKFNKNYRILRKAAIKDEVYSTRKGRAILDLLDALDGVLDDHDQMMKEMQEDINTYVHQINS